MLAPRLAQSQGVRGEASVTTTGGYGRIVIREYIGAARRGPDGRALRFARNVHRLAKLNDQDAVGHADLRLGLGRGASLAAAPSLSTVGASSPEFREVARIVASGDTLSGFLRDLRARYPEMQGVLPEATSAPANTAPRATKADHEPTGSIVTKTQRRVSAQ
jgi:hypothetical protein